MYITKLVYFRNFSRYLKQVSYCLCTSLRKGFEEKDSLKNLLSLLANFIHFKKRRYSQIPHQIITL